MPTEKNKSLLTFTFVKISTVKLLHAENYSNEHPVHKAEIVLCQYSTSLNVKRSQL